MKERLKTAWQVLNHPSIHYSLGFLTVGGFIAGVIFWGAFNTVLEATNTEVFCVSCHEMEDNVFCGAEGHHSLQQSLRRSRDLPGLSRAPRMDGQDCAKNAGVEGSLGKSFRHYQYAREVPRTSTHIGRAQVGEAQGKRFPRVPKLPRLRFHGFHQAEQPSRRGPREVSVRRRENLY